MNALLAGFQYIALDIEVPDKGFDSLDQIIFTLRYIGFTVSLFGALVCLVSQEYLKGLKNDNLILQVKGVLRHSTFIQLGDYLAILAVGLLVVASNLLLWTKPISNSVKISCNVVAFASTISFLYYFFIVIVKRQMYDNEKRNLYEDPDFGKKK